MILECDDYAQLVGADLLGRRLLRAEARTARAIDQLLAAPGSFEIAVSLDGETAARLLSRPIDLEVAERLVLTLSRPFNQPTSLGTQTIRQAPSSSTFSTLPSAAASSAAPGGTVVSPTGPASSN